MPSLEIDPAGDRIRYLRQETEYKKRRYIGLAVSMLVAFIVGAVLSYFVDGWLPFAVLAVPISVVLLVIIDWWANRAFK
jgi:uncharacterized membrane protein YoaK (UPF0700 family)